MLEETELFNDFGYPVLTFSYSFKDFSKIHHGLEIIVLIFEDRRLIR